MTADLAQACTDLAAWLHPIRELITQPDTQPTPGREKPASKPPWNTAPASLYFDIHAGLRDIEQQFRYDATRPSRTTRRRTGTWTDQRTLHVIQSINRLAPAAEPEHVDHAVRQINGWIIAAMQLPAVDLEQPWRKIPGPCPRCTRAMLRYRKRDYGQPAQLACLSCMRHASIVEGKLSDGCVEWDDGEIT